MGSEDGVTMINRAEIDTRAPFRSVKEAVTLFGERVLAGELYANKLKEMHDRTSENGHNASKYGTMTAELEETKQSLEKAKEESMVMANCLCSLKEELEHTKRELKHLREKETRKKFMEMTIMKEIEDVKVVEDTTKFELVRNQTSSIHEGIEFQKKRYVTFANPPSVTQVIVPQGPEVLERHPSLRKKKKKPLLPLIGGIFSKKKGSSEIS